MGGGVCLPGIGVNTMEACLGVSACDRCREPMKVGQGIVIMALSTVARENCQLEAPEPGIRYTCHLDCQDGVEVAINRIAGNFE